MTERIRLMGGRMHGTENVADRETLAVLVGERRRLDPWSTGLLSHADDELYYRTSIRDDGGLPIFATEKKIREHKMGRLVHPGLEWPR